MLRAGCDDSKDCTLHMPERMFTPLSLLRATPSDQVAGISNNATNANVATGPPISESRNQFSPLRPLPWAMPVLLDRDEIPMPRMLRISCDNVDPLANFLEHRICVRGVHLPLQ
jgi:hypothetical protein